MPEVGRPSISSYFSPVTLVDTMVRPVKLLIANSGRTWRLSLKLEHEFSGRGGARIGEDPMERVASEEIFKHFRSPGLVSLKWDAGINTTTIARGNVVRLPSQLVKKCPRGLQSLSLKR